MTIGGKKAPFTGEKTRKMLKKRLKTAKFSIFYAVFAAA